MLSIALDHLLKNSKLKDNIIRLSFFTFQGLFGAVVINDILRLLFGDFEYKSYLEAAIASFVVTSPFIHPRLIIAKQRTNNFALGAGMFVGTAFCYYSENKKGKQVLQIPLNSADNESPHKPRSPATTKEYVKARAKALQEKAVDPSLILGGVLEPPMPEDDKK